MPAKDTIVKLRVDSETKERWQRRAADEGYELSAWIRDVLDRQIVRTQYVTTAASWGGSPVKAQMPTATGPGVPGTFIPQDPVALTACRMAWAHRMGVHCKTCGQIP